MNGDTNQSGHGPGPNEYCPEGSPFIPCNIPFRPHRSLDSAQPHGIFSRSEEGIPNPILFPIFFSRLLSAEIPGIPIITYYTHYLLHTEALPHFGGVSTMTPVGCRWVGRSAVPRGGVCVGGPPDVPRPLPAPRDLTPSPPGTPSPGRREGCRCLGGRI